ncbi:MAG: hypothetical protein M3238_02475 [Actinomycetota bacterium]|nr:hypothetical protein [Actinomycetota bacterium]
MASRGNGAGTAAVRKLALFTLAVMMAIPLLALARHLDVQDPNDTEGLLDVRRVEVDGTRKRPNWTITTFAAWTAREIWDTGFVIVALDTIGTRRQDYYALVASNGRSLTATLYRDRKQKRDRRITAVPVRRDNRRSLKVTIPLGRTQRRSSRIYSWYVQTLFSSRECPNVCFDRAPDRGMISEPGTEPTPTTTLPTP